MERIKMPQSDRAKQFAPFDALKGLQDALRIKEYEFERVQKGEVQEEKAIEISKTLINLEKNNIVEITYYSNGHYLSLKGCAKLLLDQNLIQIANKKISLNNLFDIKIIS